MIVDHRKALNEMFDVLSWWRVAESNAERTRRLMNACLSLNRLARRVLQNRKDGWARMAHRILASIDDFDRVEDIERKMWEAFETAEKRAKIIKKWKASGYAT
jgi:hypothetical protein